jgi:hypothetical protein
MTDPQRQPEPLDYAKPKRPRRWLDGVLFVIGLLIVVLFGFIALWLVRFKLGS